MPLDEPHRDSLKTFQLFGGVAICRHLGVGTVDDRLVEAGLGDARLFTFGFRVEAVFIVRPT